LYSYGSNFSVHASTTLGQLQLEKAHSTDAISPSFLSSISPLYPCTLCYFISLWINGIFLTKLFTILSRNGNNTTAYLKLIHISMKRYAAIKRKCIKKHFYLPQGYTIDHNRDKKTLFDTIYDFWI
jgi:hypothetical protein